MFESPERLALGLATGIAFGFLLHKARVSKPQVIVGQLLLKNWTVAKVMGSAIVVGAIGVFAMRAMGIVELHLKPALLAQVLVGGAVFGIGMAVYGYCPGTGVAATGEGRKDALAGIFGMLAGAAIYVFIAPWVAGMSGRALDFGKVNFPQLTHSSPWLWLAGGLLIAAVMLTAIQRSAAAKR